MEYTVGINDDITAPSSFILLRNYPNPFNSGTDIIFDIPESGRVSIAVYNVLGQKITDICNDQYSAGHHIIGWNAAGQPTGVYFIRMKTGSYSTSIKTSLLK